MLRTMLPAAISRVRAGKFSWISACTLALVLLMGFWPLPAAARSHKRTSKARHHAAANRHSSQRHHSRSRHSRIRRARYSRHTRRSRGQQAISRERTLEIQRALIRQHYLADGQDSGQWDQATRDALARYQGDNHWQTKILPDSRALIKLGLGPSRENLLNPESAAIGMPGWRSLAAAGQTNGVNSSLAVANN